MVQRERDNVKGVCVTFQISPCGVYVWCWFLLPTCGVCDEVIRSSQLLSVVRTFAWSIGDMENRIEPLKVRVGIEEDPTPKRLQVARLRSSLICARGHLGIDYGFILT
jgi:hypothetical protein